MKIDILFAQKLANLLNKYINYRKTFEKNNWSNFFKENSEIAIFPIDNDIKINLFKDSILCKLIFNGFEKKEQLFIMKYLKEGDIFFDIGANIGLHSICAAKVLQQNGAVFSFEPSKSTFERLKLNIELNNFQNIITPIQAGVSNTNEKLILNVSSDGYDAWNSFAKLNQLNSPLQEEVEVLRLDNFITLNIKYTDKLSLIKIDVEGWELMVIEGLGKVLENKNFKACFLIEFTEENTFSAGYSCRDIYRYLTNYGYEWFLYDEITNTLIPSPLKPYYPYENLIAVKSGQIDDIRLRLIR